MMAAKNGKARLQWLAAVLLLPCLLASEVPAQTPAPHDGAHDFDFLIGDWKTHVRRLPEAAGGLDCELGLRVVARATMMQRGHNSHL